jgi:hypothetical protein
LKDKKSYTYKPRAVNQHGVFPDGIFNDTSDVNRSDILTEPSTTNSVTRPIGPLEITEIDEAARRLDQTSPNGELTLDHRAFEEKELHAGKLLQENSRAASSGDFEHIIHAKRGDTNSAKSSSSLNVPYQTTGGTLSEHLHAHDVDGSDGKIQEFLSAGEQALPSSQTSAHQPRAT